MNTDTVLKRYLSDNTRYADLINGMVFHGRQVVTPQDLSPWDSQSTTYENRSIYRDLIKKTAFGINFAVIGIENQQQVHYLMPLRAAEYDIANYRAQATEKSKQIHALCAPQSLTSSEYLSGFRKSDHLHPCITLILFYGEEWDGSRDLHGLLDFSDIPEELHGLIPNYSLNLLEINKLPQTDIFHSDLKQVIDISQCAKDKKKMKKLVESDEAFQHMDADAYDVAAAMVHSKELEAYRETHKEGEMNMCKALQDWAEEERTLGRAEGLAEGMAHLIQSFSSLVQDGILSLQEAARRIQMSEEEFRTQMEHLEKNSCRQ